MPIYHKVEQRSAVWFALRVGLPTASAFDRIITPGGKIATARKPGGGPEGYAHELLAELMLGRDIEDPYQSQWMQRGQDIEDNAVEAFEFTTGLETKLGGFVTNDAGTYGCSPDRLIGDNGGMEMKSNKPNTHMRFLLNPASLEEEKKVQVQGCLLVTEREWWDLVSFHPEMPTLIRRVQRDEKYLRLLKLALDEFCVQLALMRERIESLYGPFKPITFDKPALPAEDDGTFVTDADVTAIWEASRNVT